MDKITPNMYSYVDMIMRNDPFEHNYNSSEEFVNIDNVIMAQSGGTSVDIKNVATGSFPPIYLATKEDLEKEKELDKGRGFAKPNKTAVSIKEIMQERRDDKKPFITL